jgi:phosphomannomutase
MGIFKAYDIRGTYPDQINEDLAYRIGLAVARVLADNKGTIVTGRDARTMGPQMQDALNRGICDGGVNVIDIGMCVTPMSYFACATLKTEGAVQNTASHNPAGYSGFKLSREGAKPVSYATGINEVEKLVLGEQPAPASVKGTIEYRDLWPEYKAWLLSNKREIPRLKVVADTGNGAAGVRLPELFEALGSELIGLYLEPDGEFPNHEPNPLKEETLRDLQDLVVKEKADLGVAYDGDGDRVMFVDDAGKIVRSDHLTALLAQDFLQVHPGAKIVHDLRSSWVVAEEIRRLGGEPVESRVGHSFIKQLMREIDSPFAGELSGHYYFRDAYFTDNAELAMIHTLNHLGRTGRKLSDEIAEVQRYYATGEINYRVDDTNAALQRLKTAFASQPIRELDGVTVEFDDWWFNVRASNTEPLLRLNLEARTQQQMEEGRKRVEEVIGGVPAAGH